MSRSLYIIGAPGSGKSTLMRSVVSALGLSWGESEKVHREIWVTPLIGEWGVTDGVSLGKERGKFSGTDALSLSALPRAIEWVSGAELPPLVVGEGMRLSSPRFLVTLDRLAPLTLVHLSVPESVAAARRSLRGGDNLTGPFVAAATTRARNISAQMEAMGYPVLDIDTYYNTVEEATQKILNRYP